MRLIILLAALLAFSPSSFSQKSKKDKKAEHPLDKTSVGALKFRCVGPALTSGRISDFAIHPNNPHVYYVATASGGVWKTINNGTTYTPIFDGQGSYSIGCVTIDPNQPDVVWVGTGENNNQRSVAYGDGVYRSTDGGSSWKHMGLKNSEHIGKIIVDPTNSNNIYVAAIGPLWSKGGDRGLYQSKDGGETWNAILTIDEHTGVTDLVMDPRNPQVMYAAAFQRARHVFTYLGGGPGSAIYKTTDGGATWNKVNSGLPSTELGRIGLAISPANPDIVYAIVEAQYGKSGFFKTTNGGASWKKQSGMVTSGNYYQEIVASPHNEDVVYTMDTWMKVTKDGGKNFKNVGEKTKHVDNHCMWINPENEKHWLVGCDGGIYETFDAATTWNFKSNLPVTQFYKVAVDNDAPFYNIYGGTQDNFSLGGPSRTTTSHGIMNSEWFITHGGDGFESQIDPQNPNIVYAQSQYGVLVRYDKLSGEEVGIQPKERKGEDQYRWNWDAPLAVSHHVPGRLYFAANKVFRSDDYGNSWNVISEDLTRQLNRNELKIMDRVWSVDAIAKNRSTSPYGTIVAFSESPKNAEKIAIGTDDGLIHVSSDGGDTWKKIDNISGVPSRTYVNAVYFSQHEENTIYAAFNHHKYGDFKPYIYVSKDMGSSWNKISNNLPERGSVYAIEEDHVDPNLIFCGTEFGVFFSPDQGKHWKGLQAGLPTIAVRDIAIQRRENDLVLGTFGRGFYVLDDYSPLRNVPEDGNWDDEIFEVRDALMYEKSKPLGLAGKAFQGDSYYTAENLGPVARIYYSIDEDAKTLKDQRKTKEKELAKDGKDHVYPTYEELKNENEQIGPKVIFTIKNDQGEVVRTLTSKLKKGLQKIDWDLRFASKAPIKLGASGSYNPFASRSESTLVYPGMYTVEMTKLIDGEVQQTATTQSFEVKALNNSVLPAENRKDKVVFQQSVNELSRRINGAQHLMRELRNKVKHIKVAVERMEIPMTEMYGRVNTLEGQLRDLGRELNGDGLKTKLDLPQSPTPAGRIGWILYEQKYSTSNVTKTHMDSYDIAKEEFAPILEKLKLLATEDVPALEKMLEEAGAPYTPGRALEMMMSN